MNTKTKNDERRHDDAEQGGHICVRETLIGDFADGGIYYPCHWYFAGKIAKNDWRHSIVGESLGPEEPSKAEPIQIRSAPKGALYVGPYFIGCDHGCSHGPNRHGLMEGCGSGGAEDLSRREVSQLCRQWLSQADVVFAWIDDLTCYGTLIEIGYASAIHKPILIGMKRDYPDLWFARTLASYSTRAENAWLAFQDCFYWFQQAAVPLTYRSIRQQNFDSLDLQHGQEMNAMEP